MRQRRLQPGNKRSPFEVVYGTNPRLEVDAQLGLDAPQVSENHETIQQSAREAIQSLAIQAKSHYDVKKNVKWRNLHNRKVYWKAQNAKIGKLSPRFVGPFLAKKTENRWNYRIEDRDGNNKVVHLDQLNECFNEEPLASGLRGRGRPRRIRTIWFNNSNRKVGGEVLGACVAQRPLLQPLFEAPTMPCF